jgi:tetratricopeptide (TPR) repeat protein
MKTLLLMAAYCCAAQISDLERARELIERGTPEKAEAVLRPLVARDASNADARLLLGTALALEGKRSESIRELLEAVKLRPQSAAAYNTLGMALSRFVENEPAREAFEKAIQLDPALADAHVNLALIMAQAGEFAPAGEHLRQAIHLQGEMVAAARTHYLLAKVHAAQNNLEQASAELEHALRLSPQYAAAWSDLGVTRRALLNEPGAIAALERAVRLNPQDRMAQYRLGSLYLRVGRPHDAVEHLQAALRADPDDRSAIYNLQMALRADGREQEAKQVEARMAEVIRRSTRASETSLEAAKLNNDGIELEKAGDLRAALEKYRAALELDPAHGGFRLNYGLALCRLGRWDQGIAEIREVVRRNPDNAQATRALYIAIEQQRSHH